MAINSGERGLSEISNLRNFRVDPDGCVIDVTLNTKSDRVDPRLRLEWVLDTVLLAARKGVSPTSWPNVEIGVMERGLEVITGSLPILEILAGKPGVFGCSLARASYDAIEALVDHGTPGQQELGHSRLAVVKHMRLMKQ